MLVYSINLSPIIVKIQIIALMTIFRKISHCFRLLNVPNFLSVSGFPINFALLCPFPFSESSSLFSLISVGNLFYIFLVFHRLFVCCSFCVDSLANLIVSILHTWKSVSFIAHYYLLLCPFQLHSPHHKYFIVCGLHVSFQS